MNNVIVPIILIILGLTQNSSSRKFLQKMVSFQKL